MLKFSLPLNRAYTRPILNLYNVKALVDFGAESLIIDMTDEAITNLFKGTLIRNDISVCGIAPEKIAGKLYCLREFRIGEMEFQNIPAIAAPIADAGIDIILGSSLYGGGCKILIDTEAEIITFEYPDRVALSKRTWVKHNNEWRILGYENDNFVVLAESEFYEQ